MIASADRANIGIVLPDLQRHFGLSNSAMGAVVSLFFTFYALGQIPSAFLVKRFGLRRIMPLSILLTSLMTAAHGLVNTALALRLARIGLGLAEAPIAIASITAINNWFPPREKGLAGGIFMASTKLGPVIVPPLGALVIVAFGWHWVFILFAIPGLLLPFLWLRYVPDDPAESPRVDEVELALIRDRRVLPAADAVRTAAAVSKNAAKDRFAWLDRISRVREVTPLRRSADVFRSWNVWGVSLSYFVLIGITNVILAWLPKYLAEVKGYPIMKVGLVASAPFVGAVVGNMLGGWLSDRVLGGRRKPLMMLSCLATVVMMNLLRFAPGTLLIVVTLFFLTGLLLSVGFALYGIFPSSLTTSDTFPIATSLLNTCGQIGGAVLPLVTGIILDHGDWGDVFLTLSGCSAVAFFLLLTVAEPRASVDPTQSKDTA
jgi:sugar phosphate permease